MFGVCLRYAKNSDEAKDMLQDGFIKVYRSIEQFNFKGSFEGWVRRIIVNTALEKIRAQRDIFFRIDSDIDIPDLPVEDDSMDNISMNDLLNMIKDLSPRYKTVFNLYVIEGYSHKEIAGMLDIEEGTSKSNLARARLILQEKIKKNYNEKIATAG